jgi:hypothetical protein
MACRARSDDIRAAALRDRVEATIDLGEHPHHLSRHDLTALLVTREIELLERLPLSTDMTELGSSGNFGMIAFRMGKWPLTPLTRR